MVINRPTPVPKTNTPERPKPKTEVPKTPDTKIPETPKIECPTPQQLRDEPVGFIFDGGRQRVTGYELQGNQCVRLVEDVKILEQVVNGFHLQHSNNHSVYRRGCYYICFVEVPNPL